LHAQLRLTLSLDDTHLGRILPNLVKGWRGLRQRERIKTTLMAIRVTLDRVLLDRRMSLTELGDRVGITLANLSILKTGKAKAIRFSTLEALCRELNCQPGDILVWDPDEAAASDDDDDKKAVAAE
jgi:putative transcriptional regulator